MKGFLLILLLTLASIGFGQKTIETINIKTSAICDMCKETLEHDLSFAKGVKSVELDLETKVLTVEYRSDKTNPDELRLAVANTGYDADDVPANPKKYKRLHACCKKGGSCGD